MRIVAVVGVVLFLLAQPAVSQAPDDKLIVPVERIGRYTLEMRIEGIIGLLGRFRSVSKIWGPTGVWQDIRTPTQLSVYHWPGVISAGEILTEDRGVTFMETWSPRVWTDFIEPPEFKSYPPPDFRTEKGISVNSSRAAVLKAYGMPTAATIFSGVYSGVYGGVPRRFVFNRLIYNDVGVAFVVDDVEVQATIIFRPGDAQTIWKF